MTRQVAPEITPVELAQFRFAAGEPGAREGRAHLISRHTNGR